MIDCGCGPIGGLAILAEMVGPAGRVVGVDFSEPTIQYARSVMAALGLENVEAVAGDIHELDAATLGGPFDLAFTRAFLMHQADRYGPWAGSRASCARAAGSSRTSRWPPRRRDRPARRGLEIAEADGFFATQDPAIGFEIHAGSLAAARERAIEAGIAAEMIDDVVAILRAAKAGGYEWVTSPFLLDLVLRKPQTM